MVLITILTLTLLILATLTIFVISVMGSVGIVLFGDVIVCCVLIALLIKFLISRKQNED